MTTELKNGNITEDRRLDRIYEEDWNSLNFPITMKMEQARPFESYDPETFVWMLSETLDQGQEGACVGFGYTHEALCRPNVVRDLNGLPLDAKFAREMVYWPTQKIDPWDGGAYPGAQPFYEGTSVLSGAKTMQSLGLYRNYYWALNVQQLALGISYTGPAVMGLKWYEGMGTPDANHFIRPTGSVVGGHCILANGVVFIFINPDGPRTWENVDLIKSYFVMHNSWGAGWGVNGECFISMTDMMTLLSQDGEACFPDRAI